MSCRILGLDPGLAILGFGIIEGSPPSSSLSPEHLSVVDFGIVETPAKTPVGDRLCILYDDLHSLIDQVQPSLVALEKLFFYRMGNTILVAQARGVITLVLAQHKLPIVEFTPAQIKQALTGYGNADKAMVQEAVMRELNLSRLPKPDDAADGLAVALTAWYQR